MVVAQTKERAHSKNVMYTGDWKWLSKDRGQVGDECRERRAMEK